MSGLSGSARKRIISIIFTTLALLLGMGHFAAGNAEADVNLETFIPDFNPNYLANPGIGWQEAHDFEQPLLPETTPYRRPQYGWKEQNPAPGVYDWSAIDADLQEAIDNHTQLSFRVYTMRGSNWGDHQVPDWVINDGAVILPGGEPLYSNCTYLAHWATFVEQMRQRYDGNPNIAFIDISGYGNYNEWSWQDQTDYDDDFLNPDSIDGQARNRLADMFIGGSGSGQCTNSDGSVQTVSYNYTGFQQTQLLMPFAGIQQSSRYVAARRPDVGIRNDCLGSEGHTDILLDKIGDVIEATWRNAPIIFELCYIEGSDPDLPDFIASADTVLKLTHGSTVHDNVSGSRPADLFSDLLRNAGYRFSLDQATFSKQAGASDALAVEMDWSNIGYAPAYARMGQNLDLHMYLLDSSGNTVADWTLDADVNSWMPASTIPGTPPTNSVVDSLTVPAGVAEGEYTLATAIIDSRTGDSIQLSITGRTAQGLYELGQLSVTANTGEQTEPPVENGDIDMNTLTHSLFMPVTLH